VRTVLLLVQRLTAALGWPAMLRSETLVAFVATTDLARARAFYGDTLDLALVEETEFACAFAAGVTTLRVTLVSRLVPAPHTVLGWSVADVEAFVRALTSRGIECLRYDGMEQDEDGIWRAPNGARIAWFQDPDGNTLSLIQPPREDVFSARA
jgi:catechol 2,3-dioxygenase-like lactoylglutathione lyase family enzyme